METPDELNWKLPYKLRKRWWTVTFELFQRTNTRIRFKNLVEFLETQSEILLHPVFGDIKDPTPVKGSVKTQNNQHEDT